MKMARQIRGMEDTKQPIIIFVTGYEKYVYDAFDVGAFQYLLKPVDEQKFAEVFRRAAEQAAAYTEQDKKCQSSYAVKSSIHAIGVKNILIFPIHEVRAEGGENGENCNLR